MIAVPSKVKGLDDGLRWGIEAMFSDVKSRGFGLREGTLFCFSAA